MFLKCEGLQTTPSRGAKPHCLPVSVELLTPLDEFRKSSEPLAGNLVEQHFFQIVFRLPGYVYQFLRRLRFRCFCCGFGKISDSVFFGFSGDWPAGWWPSTNRSFHVFHLAPIFPIDARSRRQRRRSDGSAVCVSNRRRNGSRSFRCRHCRRSGVAVRSNRSAYCSDHDRPFRKFSL